MFKLSPFVNVILKKENQVLLIKRVDSAKWYPGFFSFPGGKIDGNETVLLASIREVREELGVSLDPKGLSVVHVCHYRKEDGFEGLDFFLQAQESSWSGELHNMEPEKHECIEWINLDKLPDNLIHIHKHAFQEINKGSFYSEFGW
ncbi:NUDIX domain-containing protein [Candidatus Dependentiae bacterium]|nr:NUDIX domain-containing protein [Candidatus Dependentiae bacterium]